MIGEGLRLQRSLLDKRPGAVRLTYISSEGSYEPGTAEVRDPEGDRNNVIEIALALVLSKSQAEQIASHLLTRASSGERATLALSLADLGVMPGDMVRFDSGDEIWEVARNRGERHCARAIASLVCCAASTTQQHQPRPCRWRDECLRGAGAFDD